MQSMVHAMADATPQNTPHIRYISFSQQSKVISVYFADGSLKGRKFSIAVERFAWKLTESTEGSIVRQMGSGAKGGDWNSFGCTFGIGKLGGRELYDAPWKETVDVTPTWEHGKLIYDVLTSAEANVGERKPSAPQAVDRRKGESQSPTQTIMPRPDRLRILLSDIRNIERNSPYRLERDTDGLLQFVARIF